MSKKKSFLRSPCAIANSLDILGDRWSLLVVRDLLQGKQTYTELAESREHIPTNILADRLKRLEAAGIISRNEYQRRPTRYVYALTPKGAELRDVLRAMVAWGTKHIPGTLVMTQRPKN
jgi:DNA-binding HxlR family transcriptional regulator